MNKGKCEKDPACMVVNKGFSKLILEDKDAPTFMKMQIRKMSGNLCFPKPDEKSLVCNLMDKKNCLGSDDCDWSSANSIAQRSGTENLEKAKPTQSLKIINTNGGWCHTD